MYQKFDKWQHYGNLHSHSKRLTLIFIMKFMMNFIREHIQANEDAGTDSK